MTENEKYSVSGMTCAACQAHVTKAVSQVKGVDTVSVNLLTNSMLVSYQEPASPQTICDAVRKAGYDASLAGGDKTTAGNSLADEREQLKDHETAKLLKRLIASLILLIPLFYFGMGYMNMDWHWPLGIVGTHPFLFGLIGLFLSSVILIINKRFFVSGFRSLIHGGPNMDTLVALGSGVSYVYGVVVLFIMAATISEGATAETYGKLMMLSMTLTFETAGMVPTLITIGKTLESYTKGRTTDAIKGLMDLSPKTAHVIRDGKEITVPAQDVLSGETFLVRPGEAFPVDGIVLEGRSTVNEAALTGESLPVDKQTGDNVSAATLNQNGALTCQATAVGNETTLHKIVEMVQTASGTKTKISRIADKVSGVFVPVVLCLAAITFVIWMILGYATGWIQTHVPQSTVLAYSINRAIAVLVIACPCALGLATPVAIMVGSGKGARNGILFKTASSLEETGKVDFAVLDKTGTITKGQPEVTDIVTGSMDEKDLLTLAASLESSSEHPLAKAIVRKAEGYQLKKTENFQALPGHGIQATIEGKTYLAGNASLMAEKRLQTEAWQTRGDVLASQGKTPLYFATENRILGIIAVSDVIKEDSKEAIEAMKKMGVTPIMLTGDNAHTAKAIASEVGIETFVSDVLPDGKLEVIRKLQKLGKVAMVGDGINDAPALTAADIGIAIGAGSNIAIDSADVVLMKSTLKDAAAAIRLSRHTLTNIKENLFWAFFYNIIMIPLAAGALSNVPGWEKLPPWMGALAMALSSVTVCLNALRINLFNVHNIKKDNHHKAVELPKDYLKYGKTEETIRQPEEKAVGGGTTTIAIEGMMCENCVRHVTQALENLTDVEVVSVSLEKKNAVIRELKLQSEDILKKAITDAGYDVVGIIKKEDETMTKTLSVEGMMCKNCRAHVQKALEGVEGVKKADVSLEEKKAVVTLEKDVDDAVLTKAVEDAGYSVKEIR